MFEQHTPWEFVWPVFLIIIGLYLMLKRGKKVVVKEVEGK
jgi:hypothetical protein